MPTFNPVNFQKFKDEIDDVATGKKRRIDIDRLHAIRTGLSIKELAGHARLKLEVTQYGRWWVGNRKEQI